MRFWGGEGLASLIASDLRGPAIAPGFSFFGACLLGLKRSKYYMLNRSGCHALEAARFPRLIPEPIHDRSGFGRQGSAAISARDRNAGLQHAPRSCVEGFLEIEKRSGMARQPFVRRRLAWRQSANVAFATKQRTSRRRGWRNAEDNLPAALLLGLINASSQALGFVLAYDMPTALRIDGLRVVIYPNDHRPPHVHVIGAGTEAVFILNCPAGPPGLRGSFGFTTAELNRIALALTANLTALCVEWERVHADNR